MLWSATPNETFLICGVDILYSQDDCKTIDQIMKDFFFMSGIKFDEVKLSFDVLGKFIWVLLDFFFAWKFDVFDTCEEILFFFVWDSILFF